MAGVADDTPAEVNFKWRRLLTFLWFGISNLLLLLIILSPNSDAATLRWVGVALIVSNICIAFFYMAGASAVDMAQVFKGASGLAQRRRPRYDYDDDDIDTPLAGDGKPI